jgi:glutathione peroxidase
MDGVTRRALCLLPMAAAASMAASAAPACPALLQHKLPRLQDEKPVDLCAYAGKVLLVVNTASQCGFTPQYKALEALHQRYASRGLVVLGFPSNDFGSQEPGPNEAIADFCENQFAVRFPMFAKSTVKPGVRAASLNPLYAGLVSRSGTAPQWNFHKYLVSRDGSTVTSRPSTADPLDPGFVREVERLLNQKMN